MSQVNDYYVSGIMGGGEQKYPPVWRDSKFELIRLTPGSSTPKAKLIHTFYKNVSFLFYDRRLSNWIFLVTISFLIWFWSEWEILWISFVYWPLSDQKYNVSSPSDFFFWTTNEILNGCRRRNKSEFSRYLENYSRSMIRKKHSLV